MTVTTIRVPIIPPNRADNPTDYDVQTFNFRMSEIAMAEDIVVSIGEFNSDILLFNSLGALVLEAQNAVSVELNAATWVSGSPYAFNEPTISSLNSLAYRCILAHSGETVDPSLDATHWILAVGPGMAPIADPVFTGEPTCPTPDLASPALHLANKQYVDENAGALIPIPGGKSVITTPTAFVRNSITADFSHYRMLLRGVFPAVASVDFQLRTIVDGLGTLRNEGRWRISENGVIVSAINDSRIVCNRATQYAGQHRGLNGWIDIFPAPLSNSIPSHFGGTLFSDEKVSIFSGNNESDDVLDDVQFDFLGQDIAAGTFQLYGVQEPTT